MSPHFRELLLFGTHTNLVAYDVEKNSDVSAVSMNNALESCASFIFVVCCPYSFSTKKFRKTSANWSLECA